MAPSPVAPATADFRNRRRSVVGSAAGRTVLAMVISRVMSKGRRSMPACWRYPTSTRPAGQTGLGSTRPARPAPDVRARRQASRSWSTDSPSPCWLFSGGELESLAWTVGLADQHEPGARAALEVALHGGQRPRHTGPPQASIGS